MRYVLILLLAALGPGNLGTPTPAQAQTRQRCFAETGHCIGGSILDYWERNGGLAVFGYPVSDLQEEVVEENWIGPVQWFERDRLEDHSAEGQGVLAGRLGASYLHYLGEDWMRGPRPPSTPTGCEFFPPTGYNVCEPFLSYWRANGGLERFGYPLSQPRVETIEGWTGTVQYFERRRMEHHTALAGTRYEVLLGLLGNTIRGFEVINSCPEKVLPELRIRYSLLRFRNDLGCPILAVQDRPMATQRFVNGEMVWVDLGTAGKKIFVIVSNQNYPPGFFYRVFDDTWREGDKVSDNLTPPDIGLYEPIRGFGKVWREQPQIRDAIGWAWEREQADRGSAQLFNSGTLLYLQGKNWVFAFGPDQTNIGSAPPRP